MSVKNHNKIYIQGKPFLSCKITGFIYVLLHDTTSLQFMFNKITIKLYTVMCFLRYKITHNVFVIICRHFF